MNNAILSMLVTLFVVPAAYALDPHAVPSGQTNYWDHIVCHGTPASGSAEGASGWNFEVFSNKKIVSEDADTTTYSALIMQTTVLNYVHRTVVNSGALLTINKNDNSLSRLYYNEYSWVNQDEDPRNLPENELYYEGFEINFSGSMQGQVRKWFEYIEAESGAKKRMDEYLDVKCLKM